MLGEREQAIEAREKAATAGPWAAKWQNYGKDKAYKIQSPCEDLAIVTCTLLLPEQQANAEFLAHAREDIPYLLGQLKGREEKLAALEKWHQDYHGWDDGVDWWALDRILQGGE